MAIKAENLSVRLPAELRDQVDEMARRARRSRSFVIKEAVAAYVRDQKQMLAEIDIAIQSADKGIGHSREQVFAWMDAWAAGDKRPLPAPDIKPDR